MILRYPVIFMMVIFISACGNHQERQSGDVPSYQVEYAGALRNMMHKGDISAKASLSDLSGMEHLYALGALEDLKGEIQVFNGEAHHSIVDGDSLVFDDTFDKKATLLVYASVPRWKSFGIPSTVRTYEQLEHHIARVAKENGMDIHAPFPFLLEGNPTSFDWHVINWKAGDMDHSHEKHIRSGLYGTIQNRAVEMLGFYSDAHHAIFTHHTTNMHIHVRTLDGLIAGHVDDMTIGEGMVLKLPDTE